MGSLVNERNGQRVVLRAIHVVGRREMRCDTCLDDKEVSRVHAVLRWNDGHWFIADQSRNGTWVDGRRLASGQAAMLAVGQKLRFGQADSSAWRISELGPPVTVLVPSNPALTPIAMARHNLLPSPTDPQLSLYEAAQGVWLVDDGHTSQPLADGDSVNIAGQSYRLQLASDGEVTQASARDRFSELPLLSFQLSLDEEHTCLQVRSGAQQADLGERSHHYGLVTLARKRLADAREGFDLAAQGWLETPQLARMLGIEVTHLNIQIYRARDQLMNALPSVGALTGVVERRRGGLRLGNGIGFEIRRGSELEGRYEPPPPR